METKRKKKRIVVTRAFIIVCPWLILSLVTVILIVGVGHGSVFGDTILGDFHWGLIHLPYVPHS